MKVLLPSLIMLLLYYYVKYKTFFHDFQYFLVTRLLVDLFLYSSLPTYVLVHLVV